MAAHLGVVPEAIGGAAGMAAGISAQEQQVTINGSGMDLIRGSLAPRLFKTAPPNWHAQTSFTKTIDMSATIRIDDAGLVASTAEKVPTSSGVILWHVNRGAGSVYRMGLVPQGATVTSKEMHLRTSPHNYSLVASADIRTRGFYLAGNTPDDRYTMECRNSFAVPYNTRVTNDVIKIAPDLGQSFSAVRVYSGDLRVVCDTVPIGNTALNGYFSAGSFSDIRDISQVAEGTGIQAVQSAFSPADLVQMSVTHKDGLKEVAAMKGIVSLIGSDVTPFFMSPNVDEDDVYDAGFTTIKLDATPIAANGWGGGGPFIIDDNNGTSPLYLSKTWFSPWGTQVRATAGTTFPAGQVAYNNVDMEAINPFGVLDFEINLHAAGNVVTNGRPIVIEGTYTHVFVSCSSTNYECTYNCVPEVIHHTVEANRLGDVNVSFKSYPKLLQSNMIKGMYGTDSSIQGSGTGAAGNSDWRAGGMYLGTSFTLRAYPGSATLTVGAALEPVNPASSCLSLIHNLTARVRARSIYGPGEIGPVRVIRWDAMGNGQVISLTGVMNAQCIPEGQIAPFVQKSAMMSDTAHSLNTLPLLAEVYNGKTPVRRNWTGDHYDYYMRVKLPELDEREFMNWMNPKLMSIATHAGGTFGAGFWKDVMSVFNRVAKPLEALPKYGSVIADVRKAVNTGADAVGSVYDVIKGNKSGTTRYGTEFGSRGQFGSRMSAGSKGQFGAAGGRRRRPRAKRSKSGGSRASSARRRRPLAIMPPPLASTASGAVRRRRSTSRASSRRSSRRSSRSSRRSATSRRSSRASSMRSGGSHRSRRSSRSRRSGSSRRSSSRASSRRSGRSAASSRRRRGRKAARRAR